MCGVSVGLTFVLFMLVGLCCVSERRCLDFGASVSSLLGEGRSSRTRLRACYLVAIALLCGCGPRVGGCGHKDTCQWILRRSASPSDICASGSVPSATLGEESNLRDGGDGAAGAEDDGGRELGR